MDLPAMSASGLFGSRMDAIRAGIMTTKDIRRASLFFFGSRRVQIARLISPHDGDTVTNRVRKPIAIANQLLRVLVVFQRTLTQRTDQDIK
jgi:hypothetical protein